MAGVAGFLCEKFFASDHRVGIASAGGAREPRGILGRFHHSDPAFHHGVICAAILRAEEMVFARLGGLEPHRVVVAGDDVHLDAESGNEKVMNDIFAGHD